MGQDFLAPRSHERYDYAISARFGGERRIGR